MYTTFFNRNKLLFALLAGVLFINSCKPEDELAQPRLFKPILNETVVTGNQLKVSWTRILGTVSYALNLSRDSFATLDRTVSVGGDTSSVTFSDLLWDQQYYISLQSIASDPALNSKITATTARTTKFPTLISDPLDIDFTDISLVIRWTNLGAAVTSVKVELEDGTFVMDIPLTAGDRQALLKDITGLTASTAYKLTLYSDLEIRGWVTYSTKPTPNNGLNLIDLRNYAGTDTILTDTMRVCPSGSIYLLRRGESYTCNNTTSAFLLDKSITIMALPGIGAAPRLIFNHEFDVTGSIDTIIFRNVDIIGGIRISDATKVPYFINTTAANTCAIGQISFENCNIKSFGNAVVRLQSGIAPWGIVTNLYVNNCIISDIGNTSSYAIFHAANGSANGNKFENISILNSTCYNFTKGLIINSMNDNTSVLVENCTFNDMLKAGYYFIDFNTYSCASMHINNCILGLTKDALLARGVRASATTSFNISNVYNTSDFVATTNPIPNVIPYANLNTALWVDPANGDFHFLDTGFPGKNDAGDPRWRE